MAAFVRSSLKDEDAPLKDIIKLEFPDQDFEGDIMAIVIVNSGLLNEEDLSASQALQIAYDPEGDIYPNRYLLFATAVGLDFNPVSGVNQSIEKKVY